MINGLKPAFNKDLLRKIHFTIGAAFIKGKPDKPSVITLMEFECVEVINL
jgi:hypothetical protein